MAMSKRFIFSFFLSIVLSFLFITLHQHLSSSLRTELEQLKSKVSLLESSIEMSNRVLQSKEDDIAQMVKMILDNEESVASVKNKIDSVQQKGSADVEGQMNAGHSQFAELEKQDWILVMKNQLLSFIYHLKPQFEFLTAVTIEACHASKKSLQSHAVKLLRSAIPFMQELQKSAMPYIKKFAQTFLDMALVSLGTLFKKMCTLLKDFLLCVWM